MKDEKGKCQCVHKCADFATYQLEAIKTASYDFKTWDMALPYLALGVVGEAGEVAEQIKKHVRGDKELKTEKIKEELGDVLWYIANLCETLGFSLQDVAEGNIAKLRKRHGETFSGYGHPDTRQDSEE